MDTNTFNLNLRPIDIEEIWDAAVTLVRVGVAYVACLWAFPFVAYHLHGFVFQTPWGAVAAGTGGIAALYICSDSWKTVLVGLWWRTGGNAGVLEETRAVMARGIAGKDAWAFATARKDVVGRFVWVTEGGGWMLMDASLEPYEPDLEEPADKRRCALIDASIRSHPQQTTTPRFHASGLRGKLERWLLPSGSPLYIHTAPFQGGSHHGLLRALAMFTNPTQKAL